MRILVTGANGFVGRAVCRAGADAGHEIVAAQRAPTPPGGAQTVKQIGDIGDAVGLADAMAGQEAVIHLVARTHVMRETAGDPEAAYRRVNVDGTAAVIEAAKSASIRRIVFMSSIKVNGEETHGQPFQDTDAPAPEDAYGRTKLEAELLLQRECTAARIDWVILRPPLVYGVGAAGNFAALLRLCDSGLPLPFGAVTKNRRSMISARNLASAAIAAATHDGAANRVFLLRDGDDVSTAALVRALRDGLGRAHRSAPVPACMLNAALAIAGKGNMARRLTGSLSVNDSAMREVLNWAPGHTTAEGLTEAARNWRQKGQTTTG